MSNNVVTYSVELTPENASKIDQINRILLGDSYSAQEPVKQAKEEVKAKTSTKAEEPAEVGVSQAKLQSAAKAAKKEHDLDFVKSCIEAVGGSSSGLLVKALSSIDPEQHENFLALLKSGPTEQASDGPDDDDDDLDEEDDDLDEEDDDLDEEDDSEVTVEAVKTALKAYAKETGRDEARELMQAAGAKSLSAVGDLSAAKLKALFKKLV